jgi:hypothetical protein
MIFDVNIHINTEQDNCLLYFFVSFSTNVRNRPSPIYFGSPRSLFFGKTYLDDFPTGLFSHSTVDSELHSEVLVYIEEKKLYFMSDEKRLQRRRWFFCMLANAALLIYDLTGREK